MLPANSFRLFHLSRESHRRRRRGRPDDLFAVVGEESEKQRGNVTHSVLQNHNFNLDSKIGVKLVPNFEKLKNRL